MKIILPHRVVKFTTDDKKKNAEDRVKMVYEILAEEFQLDDVITTVEDYLVDNFSNKSSEIAMDMLSYFMTKEFNLEEDIISRKGMKQMVTGSPNYTSFSGLGEEAKAQLGISDNLE